MALSSCPFCSYALAIVRSLPLAFAVRDISPVTPLHTLIIPTRHIETIFQATSSEREALHHLSAICIDEIRTLDQTVEGFNFGMNIGIVAGQKVPHPHLHLIPRRVGDLPPPPTRQDLGR